MYIIKNALRCIGRSKGRNVLIGIIALVIAVSACLGLSIRQAADSSKEDALAKLTITAKISATSNKEDFGSSGGFNPEFMNRREQNILSLEEYEKYATAESVSDFYYTLTASFNGSEEFSPVTNEEEDETEENSTSTPSGMPEGLGGMNGMPEGFNPGNMPPDGFFGNKGNRIKTDFSVVGYSSDSSMTAFFKEKTSTITEGKLFEEGSSEMECVISEELANFNQLSVGDKITLTNPALETETYELTIVGLYKSPENSDFSMSSIMPNMSPANQIYLSANALQVILDASEEASVTITDEDSGRESESVIRSSVEATYVFTSPESYNAFEDEARALGLDDTYEVSSSDLSSFEASITPLNTLSTMAGWFLLVILIIGAVILVVLNIFNVRERKYEVGVLTAMGMKKWKVAAQFMYEILIVTMIAVIIGATIGAVSAVPVTNTLLEGQIESEKEEQAEVEENIGRDANFPQGGFGGGPSGGPNMGNRPEFPSNAGSKGDRGSFGKAYDKAVDYISEVNSAMNLTVVFQMLGVGLLLTLAASMASVAFIMRYDPLKILANRD